MESEAGTESEWYETYEKELGPKYEGMAIDSTIGAEAHANTNTSSAAATSTRRRVVVERAELDLPGRKIVLFTRASPSATAAATTLAEAAEKPLVAAAGPALPVPCAAAGAAGC